MRAISLSFNLSHIDIARMRLVVCSSVCLGLKIAGSWVRWGDRKLVGDDGYVSRSLSLPLLFLRNKERFFPWELATHSSSTTDAQHNIQKDLRYCVLWSMDVKLSSPRTKLTLDLWQSRSRINVFGEIALEVTSSDGVLIYMRKNCIWLQCLPLAGWTD